ncbi:MAG: LssY C-terminal domain-containing protein [Acidobacteria bacterium]|nr:LssY C-terminal domain-containing protein [Acidobacteriota bacterium]
MRAATAIAFLLLAGSGAGAELPPGTEIQVRLKSKVTSKQSKEGDRVEAVVSAPVLSGGEIVIPAGSKLEGRVKDAQRAKEPDQRAALSLEFGELEVGNGKKTKLETKLTAVDNARETVDESGRIVGILATETLTAKMDQGIEKLGKRASALADILQAAKEAFLKAAEVEIDYGPGVEMTLQLTKEVRVSGMKATMPEAIGREEELLELVNRQPLRTMAEKPPQPSDLTNLMFIGSREGLEKAFEEAGWQAAAKLNAQSGLETFRAIAENRGYKEAPVSTLLLDGKKPDLAFQRQNNTFAKRHHLRIWRRPGAFQGQEVWVAAATHDIGIEFSPESRTFIHKVENQIDRERAKVVNDLALTGQVKGLALVERPEAPRESQNATGDKLETDGSMAVLLFK